MEKTIRFNITRHNVKIKNAKTGAVEKEFTQTRKPKDTKVIGDFLRERDRAKLPYIPVELDVTVETEVREIDYSVFMANSRIVIDETEAETATETAPKRKGKHDGEFA